MLIVVLTPKVGIAFKMHTTVQLGIQISSETAKQAPRGLIVRRYGCLQMTHTLTRGPRQQMLEHPLSQTFSPRLFGDHHLPDKQCAGLVGQKVTRDKAHQLIVLKDSHSGVGKVCALQQIAVGRVGVEGGGLAATNSCRGYPSLAEGFLNSRPSSGTGVFIKFWSIPLYISMYWNCVIQVFIALNRNVRQLYYTFVSRLPVKFTKNYIEL